MQTVRITSSRHDTSGKFIHDQHLIVLHHIVLVQMHQGMGTQRQVHAVLDLQVLGIGKILQVEEALYFLYALLRQVHGFLFFICHIVSGLAAVLFHDDVHFGEFLFRTSFQLTHQIITGLIDFCGFAAGSGYDKRCPGLINKNRIHLIHDGIVQIPLHELLIVDHHIVTEIIKSQFIIGSIGDITVICFPPLIVVHTV